MVHPRQHIIEAYTWSNLSIIMWYKTRLNIYWGVLSREGYNTADLGGIVRNPPLPSYYEKILWRREIASECVKREEREWQAGNIQRWLWEDQEGPIKSMFQGKWIVKSMKSRKRVNLAKTWEKRLEEGAGFNTHHVQGGKWDNRCKQQD